MLSDTPYRAVASSKDSNYVKYDFNVAIFAQLRNCFPTSMKETFRKAWSAIVIFEK